MARKIRVVIAKPGLDGHDRGAKIIARALRDAGMEVIYTGLHQTPEQIVETAIQEDADAVGISILSGAHMTLVPRILEGLKENGVDDVLVLVGGHDPDRRRRGAEEQGRRGRLHPRRADERDRRLPAGKNPRLRGATWAAKSGPFRGLRAMSIRSRGCSSCANKSALHDDARRGERALGAEERGGRDLGRRRPDGHRQPLRQQRERGVGGQRPAPRLRALRSMPSPEPSREPSARPA